MMTVIKQTLSQHIRTHTGEEHYVCGNCGKLFSTQWHLSSHIRTHTGKKPYVCEHCGKSFSEQGNLRKHITTHIGEKYILVNTVLNYLAKSEI